MRRRHDNGLEAMLLLIVILAILAAGAYLFLRGDTGWGPSGGY